MNFRLEGALNIYLLLFLYLLAVTFLFFFHHSLLANECFALINFNQFFRVEQLVILVDIMFYLWTFYKLLFSKVKIEVCVTLINYKFLLLFIIFFLKGFEYSVPYDEYTSMILIQVFNVAAMVHPMMGWGIKK